MQNIILNELKSSLFSNIYLLHGVWFSYWLVNSTYINFWHEHSKDGLGCLEKKFGKLYSS
jgi:hypothetical protein